MLVAAKDSGKLYAMKSLSKALPLALAPNTLLTP